MPTEKKQPPSNKNKVAAMTSCDALVAPTDFLDSANTSTGSLDRRKILITGCSSGIGAYTAKKLHDDGHVVVAACRQPQDVKMLIDEGYHAVQIDLDDSESIDAGIRDTLAITNGQLDILINNAAYGQPGAVEDLTREVLEKQFSANVFGTHELTVKLIRTLLASEQPRIIQVSSMLGLVALRYRGAYVASKFALEGLTDALRLELADTKLRVVLVEPGPITSRFRQNAHQALLANVNMEKSRHCDRYKRALKRFDSDKPQPFTLSEAAVYKKIDRAIHASRPKPRYYVTFPTYLFGTLRRLLSSRWLDAVLLKISDGEDQRFNK